MKSMFAGFDLPTTVFHVHLTELVRGCEKEFVDEFAPLSRQQDLSLDLAAVQRIDAAGIAALISLYRSAQESGHRFSVVNLSSRVSEILILVGLEQMFASHNVVRKSHCGPRTSCSVA
jgi:anti-anti-sigma factor